MSTTTNSAEWRAYGNFIHQKSPGILGAGLLASGILLSGLIMAMLLFPLVGLNVAMIVAIGSAVAFIATGTPVGPAVLRRVAFFDLRRKGEHQWRSGMTSRNKSPQTRLPGMLGRTTLSERLDPFGAPFVVIHNPARGGTYTVVARCVADGPWMHDQEQVDIWVGRYSQVLSVCAQESALICAKAITDTAPDPGGRLAAAVESTRDPNAPALARQIMDEIVADYPSASSENVTYFELTFRGRSLDRKNREDVILTELARRIPGIMGQLAAGGAGSVGMVTADELPTIIRCAYDPAAAPFLEQAELSGADQHVEWDEAGPVAAQEWWDHYTHDSGHSVTWEMYGAPRSAITERALTRLLMPHSDFARKRIAIIYRPHAPDVAARVSEHDANTAVFEATQSKARVKASASIKMRATEQSRQEVASGAGLIRWYLMVTATVLNSSDLIQAVSTVESNAGAVPMRLRRTYGSQAAGFAATLPVGFVPWEHTAIPDRVRELM